MNTGSYLYADSDRLTKEVDPLSRQMMVTQGAFLEYVRAAGDQSGDRTKIEMFPQGGYDEQKLEKSMDDVPVAKITLAEAAPRATSLYDGMWASRRKQCRRACGAT